MVPERPYYKGKDMLFREIVLPSKPQRIISLVPSLTELICYLGLKDNLAGITKFCTFPSELKSEKTIIGGTKTVSIHRVLSLKPDLVIANKEENNAETIRNLEQYVPVWVSDVRTVDQALEMFDTLSQILDAERPARILTDAVKSKIDQRKPVDVKRRVAYFIWKDPWMLAGRDTYINSMMDLAGYENIAAENMGRYPVLSAEEIKALDPDILLFSTEPFPFNKEKINQYSEFASLSSEIVDGRLYSWYSNALIDFLDELNNK